MLFSCIFPYVSSRFLSIPSYFLHFHNIFYNFYNIILQYSPTKIAVLAIFLHFSLYFPMFFLSFPLPTITFSACSRYIFSLFHPIFLHFHGIFSLFSCILPGFFLRLMLFSYIFPCFSSHFLYISCIFTVLSRYFPAFSQVLSSVWCYFLAFFQYVSSHFLSIASYFLHFHSIFYDFYDIILQYSAAKITDLGGIDTPLSAHCLVAHSKTLKIVTLLPTWERDLVPFRQPLPHPLFSLRSQTATSQLAGFRNYKYKQPPWVTPAAWHTELPQGKQKLPQVDIRIGTPIWNHHFLNGFNLSILRFTCRDTASNRTNQYVISMFQMHFPNGTLQKPSFRQIHEQTRKQNPPAWHSDLPKAKEVTPDGDSYRHRHLEV